MKNSTLNYYDHWVPPLMIGIIGSLIGISAVSFINIKKKKLQNDSTIEESVPFPSHITPIQTETNISRVGTLLLSKDIQENLYRSCIYFDYNATTPVYPEVFEAMVPYLTSCFGNPSSSHIYGERCREVLKKARESVGNLVKSLEPLDEIVFTSCGTESDNRAIDIALDAYLANNKSTAVLPRMITSQIEHPAIFCYLRWLRDTKQIELRIVPVNSEGFINMEAFNDALSINTALVTIMHSNNEVGTIQPIREISNAIRIFHNKNPQSKILFHTDAAQSVGKVPIDVEKLGVDLLTIVGHKFGAPKGIGALYVRKGIIVMNPFLIGGGQEQGRRGGTESVALISGLAKASDIALLEGNDYILHTLELKCQFLHQIFRKLSHQKHLILINGPKHCTDFESMTSELKMLKVLMKSDGVGNRKNTGDAKDVVEQLPNTLSISFKGIKSYELLKLLSDKVACSAGSACHAVVIEAPLVYGIKTMTDIEKVHVTNGATPSEMKDQVSDVLMAMKVPIEYALGTLRISFGRHSLMSELDVATDCIANAVKELWLRIGQ